MHDHVPLDYFSTLRFLDHPARWNFVVRDEMMPMPLPSDPVIRAALFASLERGIAEMKAGLYVDGEAGRLRREMKAKRDDRTDAERQRANVALLAYGIAPKPWQRSR